MNRTESRPAHPYEPASDDSASLINPQPVEPGDRLAFEPVPLRYRSDGLTPEKQRHYVEALADTGIAREAAARVGLSEQGIARVRRRSDAVSFDRACEAAHVFGARRLRSVAFERAIEGRLKSHYYRGELIGQERVHDNRLLTYLLGKTEHLLVASSEKSRVICENWEAHMDALEQGLDPPDRALPAASSDAARPEFTGFELTEDDDGIWWIRFPPPQDFDGEEQGRYGDDAYRRTLSPREQAVLDADLEQELGEERAEEAARRDRLFGFAGGEFSPPLEAEPSETTEPFEEEEDGSEGPLEYKAMAPPYSSSAFCGRMARLAESPGGSLDGAPWARAEGLGSAIPYTGLGKTPTSSRFAVSPSSPVKDGRGIPATLQIQTTPSRHPCY